MPRPKKSDPRDILLKVRCNRAEDAAFYRCAKAAGKRTSTWAREFLWNHAVLGVGMQGQLYDKLAAQHEALLEIAAASSRTCKPADAMLIMQRLAEIETQLMTLLSRIEYWRDRA